MGEKENMPFSVVGHCIVHVDEKIIVIGGNYYGRHHMVTNSTVMII